MEVNISSIVMTTFLVLIIMLSSSPTPSTKADQLTPAELRIPPGTSLSPGTAATSCWLSQSGRFAFGFYPPQQANEFVVGIWLVAKNNRNLLVWTANRDDPPITSSKATKLQFTINGSLVLLLVTDQGQEQKKLIAAAAAAAANATTASMLNSGNFVLYDKYSRIVWQSFDHPTDTLLGGQSLPGGAQLVSSLSQTDRSTGRFALKMQNDGNLVMYPAYTTEKSWDAYWNSGTAARVGMQSIYHLYLSKTGLLQIRNNSNSKAILTLSYGNESENQTIYRATLDLDGVFRLYAHHINDGSNTTIGKWPPRNMCEVRGYCGFNSYCTFNDDLLVCNCLRGYKFIDEYRQTLGCQRNYSKGDQYCRSGEKAASSYNMVSMNNIIWKDHPYFEEEGLSSQDECSSTCLADCNCWAALYDDANGNCKRLGLPFRYVRRTTQEEEEDDTSNTTFLKVVKNNTIQNQTQKGNNQKDKAFSPQPPPAPVKTTSNNAVMHIIVVTLVFTTFLCFIIAISVHYIYKIRVLRYKRLAETGNNLGLSEGLQALRRFSYGELRRATNNFKEELGKGSFGAVYKGALNKLGSRSRRLIAVKRLEKLVEEGEREFQAEVRAIGKTHHRNLVRLLGFCAEGSKRLLVYEYMSNGSLGNLLFGNQAQSRLLRRPDWDERVRIALDIARGILYLHEECEAPIIHCDIKPQNILMDDFWTAKISDFGLAKLLMPDQTRTFTMVRGTRGYLAPEWHKNTPISVKADVYSYGIVLLEILCCRRNLQVNNVSEPEEVLLSGWAYRCFVAGELNKLVPWEVDIDTNVLENMIKVAFWCIQDEPVLRPTMKSVVLMIQGITDIAIPPCPTPNSNSASC